MAIMTAPRLWLISAALAAALFTAWPGLDLWFTGLFWSPEQGFFLRDWPPFHWAYAALPAITWTIIITLLALLGFVVLGEDDAVGNAQMRAYRRRILFLLLSFALGPGLLTNTLLKDHWGRARPAQVVEFGGGKTFTPALLPAGQCERNCGFVSGHAAMAFSLVSFAFLPATRRRRRGLAAAALGFGGFVGLARIAQGGHFLSDTVFAGLLVTGTAWLLHRIVVDWGWLDRPPARRFARMLGGWAVALGKFVIVSSKYGWRRWLGFNLVCVLAAAASIAWFDRPLARLFATQDDRLAAWLRWITDLGLGAGWLIGSGGLAVALFLLGRAPRFAERRARFTAWALVPSFVFLAVALSGLAADFVKILVGRTRPKLYFADGTYDWGGLAWRADHWSFPSGHTTNVAALALALYFIWPRHAVAYALFVALVALSRIGTAQHFLSDTIGGVWIAVLVTCYVRGVFLRGGIDLDDAKAGVIAPRRARSWHRLLVPWRAGSP